MNSPRRARAATRIAAAMALAAGAAGAASGEPAPPPEAWRNWRHWAPIEVQAGAGARLVRVRVPIEVHGEARDALEDLRVIDAGGNETPFILLARHGGRQADWRGARVSETGFVPGRFTEALADAGEGEGAHNTLELLTDESDFFEWVEVAAGDDREGWRIVRERAPVYRFRKDGIEGNRKVSYTETRSRWVRLRVLRPDRPFGLSGCRIGREVETDPELVPLAAAGWPAARSEGPETRWEVDLGAGRVPARAARFTAGRPEFHRPVVVSVQDLQGAWKEAGQGEIYRYGARRPDAGPPPDPGGAAEGMALRESLQVTFGEASGRRWRIAVVNRSDEPIEGMEVELLGTPRWVVFRAEPGNDYRLLWGQSRAEAARYEMERLTVREETETAAVVALGTPRVNPDFVSPEPWTERNVLFLWAALALAVAVLGFIAVRALRRA